MQSNVGVGNMRQEMPFRRNQGPRLYGRARTSAHPAEFRWNGTNRAFTSETSGINSIRRPTKYNNNNKTIYTASKIDRVQKKSKRMSFLVRACRQDEMWGFRFVRLVTDISTCISVMSHCPLKL